MVQKAYTPERQCVTCWRPTRHKAGSCSVCRGQVKEVEIEGQPTVEEMGEYVRSKLRFIQDNGMNPAKDRADIVDAMLARERFPPLADFVNLLRGRRHGGDADVETESVPVVQEAHEGGKRRVRGLLGDADCPVGTVHPGEHATGGGPGRGVATGATDGDGAVEAGADAAAGEAGEVQEVQPARVRVRQFWFGLRAGGILPVLGREKRRGVTMVRVAVADGTLFGVVKLIPENITEEFNSDSGDTISRKGFAPPHAGGHTLPHR